MDEDEITYLKCDVELNITGSTIEDVNARAAQEVRKLAVRIEKNEFGDGFHQFAAQIGEVMGEVYIDYSGLPAENFDA